MKLRHYIASPLLPLGGIFLLPVLPKLDYLPLALPFGILLLLWSLVLWKKVRREKWMLGPSGLGMLLVVAVVFAGSLAMVMQRDASALSYKAAQWLLVGALFFAVPPLRGSDVQGGFRKMALVALAFWLVWVGWHAWGVDFAGLTVRLSYVGGMGNVSQVAMYAGLAGLLVAGSGEPGKWEMAFVGLALGGLAWMLESKLLAGILVLCLLAVLLKKLPLRIRRGGAMGLLGLAMVVLGVFPPGSLVGRMDAARIIMEQHDWSRVLGLGPGQMDRFFNEVFFSGAAENTIGEIGPIAFNDFAQALAEMGVFGLLGLMLVAVGVLLGKRPLLGLALVGMTAFMFPLQYWESAALWVVAAKVLEGGRPVFSSVQKWRLGLTGFLLGCALVLLVVFIWRHHAWHRTERLFANGDRGMALERYAELEADFQWNASFHLKHGRLLLAEGKRREGLAKLRLALGLNPSYTALTHLADACFDARLFEEAQVRYRQAELLRPEQLFPAYRRVFCLVELGQTTAAEQLRSRVTARFGKSRVPLEQAMLEELKQLDLIRNAPH